MSNYFSARLRSACLVLGVLSIYGTPIAVAQDHVAHRVLVRFSNGMSPAKAQSALASVGGKVDWEIPGTTVKVVSLPPSANEAAIAVGLAHKPGVEFAEVDALIQASAVTPNDPWYANWQPQLRQINAPAAWSFNWGSPNLTVAVIGSGVYGQHPDLAGNMVPGWNFYNNNADASDVVGHDTCVAGIIGATANNGIGVASVASGVKLMPLRVTDLNDYATYSSIASAITYAADHGCKIAVPSFAAFDSSSTLQVAAHYMYSKGGLVISPSGNSGYRLTASDDSQVLEVSAVNGSLVIEPTSSTGSCIDLCAPSAGYTPQMTGGYGSFGGTCAASAYVTGAVALVWSANSALTNAQVVNVLRSSAMDLGPSGYDTSYGAGLLDVGAAVAAASGQTGGTAVDSTAPTITGMQPSNGQMVQGLISVTAQASDNVGVASMSLAIDGVQVASSSSGSCSYWWDTSRIQNGSHQIVASSKDAAGNSSNAAVTVTVSNPADTTPPAVSITNPLGGSTVGNSFTASAVASDNVGVSRVELYVDGKLSMTDTAAPWTFSVASRKWAKGNHTLVCRAYDAAGNRSDSAAVTVVH